MTPTLKDRLAAAKAEYAERRSAALAARVEQLRVSKIPAKTAGGGKGAKREANRLVQEAQDAAKEAAMCLREVEELIMKQGAELGSSEGANASKTVDLEGNKTVNDSDKKIENEAGAARMDVDTELETPATDVNATGAHGGLAKTATVDIDNDSHATSPNAADMDVDTGSGDPATDSNATGTHDSLSKPTKIDAADDGFEKGEGNGPATTSNTMGSQGDAAGPSIDNEPEAGETPASINADIDMGGIPVGPRTSSDAGTTDTNAGISMGGTTEEEAHDSECVDVGLKRRKTSKKRSKTTEGETDQDSEAEASDDGTESKRKKKSKTKREGAAKFEDLTDEAKEKLTENGQKAIDAYLKKKKPIPFAIQRLVREVQDFLPATATTSRALALHVLDTNRGNAICLFHQHNRSFTQVDGFGQKYILVGVPHAKSVKTTKDGTSDSKLPPAPAGHLHCGCNQDIALLDLFWWKTWALRSTKANLQLSEGMRDEVLPTRTRAFFAQAFTEMTGLTVDDLYAKDIEGPEYKRALRLVQVARFLAEINEINSACGSPLLVLNTV